MPTSDLAPPVVHRHVDVHGLKIFYREAAAPESARSLLLLHGFHSASHQFRQLIDALERRSFVGARFTAAY